jgi:transposase
LVQWSQKAGPSVSGLIEAVMSTRIHPQHGFRSCLGIQRLGERYGGERLEAACRRALQTEATSYRSVRSILQLGLDRCLDPGAEPAMTRPLLHENLRGASYYDARQKPC